MKIATKMCSNQRKGETVVLNREVPFSTGTYSVVPQVIYGKCRHKTYHVGFRVNIIRGRGRKPKCWTNTTLLRISDERHSAGKQLLKGM